MRPLYCTMCTFLLVLPFLAGCGAPTIETRDHAAIEVPDGKESKAIGLQKVVSKISRGTKVGELKGGVACRRRSDIMWNANRRKITDEEWTSVFYEELKQANYKVVGDPENLFEERGAVDIAVGGKITEVVFNVCYPTYAEAWNYEFDGGTAAASVSVEWQVYDTMEKKVLHRVFTSGAVTWKFTGSNDQEALFLAFSSAVRGLLADKTFHKLVMPKEGAERGETPAVPQAEGGEPPSRTIPLAKADYKGSLPEAQKRVVVLQRGNSHGSGYLVGDSGLILTNDHVVGDAKTMRVIYSNGAKAEGRVLKSNSKQDVAMVQVDAPPLSGLRVRLGDLPVGTDVYAIGAPNDIKLQGTVSRGVVSSYRYSENGARWLQSDTTVNHGNSGGPLVDAQGRLVGMCSWGYNKQVAEGLNFFVPAAELLQVMGLEAK